MERPAVIARPDASSHADLLAAVRTALNAASVTLADGALTQDSLLLIESERPQDAEGRLLQGRETRTPERFRLVLVDSRCVLIHERTLRRYELRKTVCTSVPVAGRS